MANQLETLLMTTTQTAARPAIAWLRPGVQLILLVCLIALVNLYRQHGYVVDDSYIELRYAHNFLTSHQLTWNRDEWVEGFTSPLHLMFVIGLSLLHVPLQHAPLVIGVVALAALVSGCARALRQTGAADEAGAALAWVALAGSAPIAIWVWGGLEPVLAAAWIAWAFAFVLAAVRRDAGRVALRDLVAAGVFFTLATLTRPELLMISAASAAGIFFCMRNWTLRERALATCALLLPVVLVQLVLIAARWSIYGDIEPNTYYAKVYGIPRLELWRLGARYVYYVCLVYMAFLPMLAIVIALNRAAVSKNVTLAICSLAFGTGLAAVVLMGGDQMPGARFVIPLLPVMMLLIAGLFEAMRERPLMRALIVLGVGLSVGQGLLHAPAPRDMAAVTGAAVGEYMESHWAPHSLVALNTAGAPPYFAPSLQFIDMLGLNDKVIARTRVPKFTLMIQRTLPGHAKGNGAYVLARQPDYIIAGYVYGEPADKSVFLGDAELSRLPEFHRCYQMQSADISPAAGWQVDPDAPLGDTVRFMWYRRICPRRPDSQQLLPVSTN